MALHRMSHRQVYNVISQAYNKHHGGKMSELELAVAIQGIRTACMYCGMLISVCLT